jgi:hypothetical protein
MNHKSKLFPYTTHIMALENTWGSLLMWVYVIKFLADGETINRNNNTFTRQQDRVSTAKLSQQDGRQFMGSGQNIYLNQVLGIV